MASRKTLLHCGGPCLDAGCPCCHLKPCFFARIKNKERSVRARRFATKFWLRLNLQWRIAISAHVGFNHSSALLRSVGKTLACYRGQWGLSEPKVEKKSENEFLGPLSPGGSQSPRQSRIWVNIDQSLLTLSLLIRENFSVVLDCPSDCQ